MFKASGGTAVYQKGPLDRCLRDVLTMNQHVIATLRTWEMSGRLLLGLDPLQWLFYPHPRFCAKYWGFISGADWPERITALHRPRQCQA